MPPSCGSDCQSEFASPLYLKNEKTSKDKDDMAPNKIMVLLVFVAGIAAAFIGTLLQRYFCETTSESSGK